MVLTSLLIQAYDIYGPLPLSDDQLHSEDSSWLIAGYYY